MCDMMVTLEARMCDMMVTLALAELPDCRGDTPLHAAACNGHVEIVATLLQYAVNPSKRNLIGFTPAALARMNGHLECLQLISQYDDGALLPTPVNANASVAFPPPGPLLSKMPCGFRRWTSCVAAHIQG